MRNEHSKRTYEAARNSILTDPKNPMGKGFARQLITEAGGKVKWIILGLGLLKLGYELAKHPEMLEQVRLILGK